MTNLLQFGDFQLNSGARSFFKLECDALTDADWECAAALVSRLVGPFSSVEGVPRGGLKLAAALEPYAKTIGYGPHLIVDDVLTSGGSLRRAWDAYRTRAAADNLEPTIAGVVLFARGFCPPWVRAVFTLPPELWLPNKEGTPCPRE